MAAFFLSILLSPLLRRALAQSIPQVPSDQSNPPQVTKSPQGQQDEAGLGPPREVRAPGLLVVLAIRLALGPGGGHDDNEGDDG